MMWRKSLAWIALGLITLVFTAYGFWATGSLAPALLIGLPATMAQLVALLLIPSLRKTESPLSLKTIGLGFAASLATWVVFGFILAGIRQSPLNFGPESVISLFLFASAPMGLYLIVVQLPRLVSKRTA